MSVRPPTASESLTVEVEPDLLRVTFSRPERQNSIDASMLADLHAALDLAERSDECRLVLLQGSGGVFCSGMSLTGDVPGGTDAEEAAARGGEAFLGLLKRFTSVPRVVVAEVDGRVTGGGVGIVAASDFAFASPRSTFSLPEALWGLLPCCVLPFLVRRLGFQPAYAMALSTLPVAADQAHRMHLVDDVGGDGGAFVGRLRNRLAKVDVATIADAKRYLRRMWFLTEDMERLAVSEFTRLMASPVVQERIGTYARRGLYPWEER